MATHTTKKKATSKKKAEEVLVDPALVVVLSQADITELTKRAALVRTEAKKIKFPGLANERFEWAQSFYQAALRDAELLVEMVFGEEPDITHQEIKDFGRWLNFAELKHAEYRASRATGVSGQTLEQLEPKLLRQKQSILLAFDKGYRNNETVKRRVRAIREGSGILGDIALILVLAADYEDFLRRCKKGEWEIIEEWRELEPTLKALSGTSGLVKKQQHPALTLRNEAYSWMVHIERRIRAAAEYMFDGQERLNDYATFVPRSGGTTEPDEEEEEIDDAEEEDTPQPEN